MPKLKLTNLASYKAYFADIATKHLDIDGFKWGNKDVIRNDNRSDLAAKFLWAMPYDNAKYGDKSSDNVHKTKTARVAYMIIPESEKFSDEDAAFDFCEGVIEQILAKMLVDKRGAMVAAGDPPVSEWNMIVTDINSWSSGPVEHKLGSTRYIGWELKISFSDNTNLAYDATKWE
jgi:hypothetical protein